jgi:hypothetical protein
MRVNVAQRLFWFAATIFVAATLAWIVLDRTPPAWDDAWYLNGSLQMYDALTAGGILPYAREFFRVLGNKAPLITALTAPLYLSFGRDPRYGPLVNIPAMVLLLVAVRAIATRLAGPRAGVLAVVIAGTTPLLYGLSRRFLVEYWLAALVAVAIWLLLESETLSRGWIVAAFGAVSGFGLLLKIAYPVYVAGPLLWFLWQSRSRGAALARIAVPVGVIAAPWYVVHAREAVERAWKSGFGAAAYDYGSSSGAYLAAIAHGVFSEYWTVIALGVLIWLLWRRVGVPGAALLCFWAASALLFFVAPNKDIRFLAPLMPAFAVALACGLHRTFRHGSAWPWLLAAGAIVPMLTVSFGWPSGSHDLGYARSFNRSRWPLEEIVKAAAQGTLVNASDVAAFNADNLQLAARELRLPVSVATTAYESDETEVRAMIGSASAVVYKEGGVQGPAFTNRWQEVVQNELGTASWIERQAFDLPDGGRARIFMNRSPATGPRIISHGFYAANSPDAAAFDAEFGGQIRLEGLGVDVSLHALRVVYRWRCLGPPLRDYWAFTHVTDSDGRVIGYLDHEILTGISPTSMWRPGDTASESLELLSPAIESGKEYHLRLGVFDRQSGVRLGVSRLTPVPGWEASLADDSTAVTVARR